MEPMGLWNPSRQGRPPDEAALIEDRSPDEAVHIVQKYSMHVVQATVSSKEEIRLA